jgi:hypothetical protein
MIHRILKDLLEAFSSVGPGNVPLAATATGANIPEDALVQMVIPTWGSASNILILPTPTPGKVVIVAGAATGGKLQSSAPATIAINGGTGASAVSAVAASKMAIAICESATSWKVFGIASDGTIAGLAAAA